MSRIVYHYTDAHGLDGILRNQELWLSDLRHMNDPNELSFGGKMGVQLVDEMLGNLPRTPGDEAQPDGYDPLPPRLVLLRAREALEQARDWAMMFAVSFCEKEDLLSQWRSYAGMAGFAIGFDLDLLTKEGRLKSKAVPGRPEEDSLSWRNTAYEVTYLDEGGATLEVMLRAFLEHAMATYDNEATSYLFFELSAILAGYKSDGFAEEKEWRLFTQMPYYGNDDGRDGEVLVRVARNGLLPYVRMRLPPGAICEVVMGPGHSTPETRRALRWYRSGPNEQGETESLVSDAQIKTSRISVLW